MTQSVYVTINQLCNKKGIDPELKEFLISLNDEIPKMIRSGASEALEKELRAKLRVEYEKEVEALSAKISAYQWVISNALDR